MIKEEDTGLMPSQKIVPPELFKQLIIEKEVGEKQLLKVVGEKMREESLPIQKQHANADDLLGNNLSSSSHKEEIPTIKSEQGCKELEEAILQSKDWFIDGRKLTIEDDYWILFL